MNKKTQNWKKDLMNILLNGQVYSESFYEAMVIFISKTIKQEKLKTLNEVSWACARTLKKEIARRKNALLKQAEICEEVTELASQKDREELVKKIEIRVLKYEGELYTGKEIIDLVKRIIQ